MTSCLWQIIKTKTAVDSKKKIFIPMVLFHQGKDQNKYVETPKAKAVFKVSKQRKVLYNPHEERLN